MPSAPRVYLDHNANSPLRPEAVAAMAETFDMTGNPSSVHAEGRALRARIEAARADVAALVGCLPAEVIFTSGATEANATAVGGRHGPVLCAGIEHASIIENISNINLISANSNGTIELDDLAEVIGRLPASDGEDRPLVTLMAANNETGVLQPVHEAAALCRERDLWFHVDAVQLAGKADLAPIWAVCDSLCLSGHKLGGPTGVGALVVRGERAPRRLIGGGGQEMNRRGGTENVPGIVGFCVAARLARQETGQWDHIRVQRDRMEAEMRRQVPDVSIFGKTVERLPNTTCVAAPGVTAETLLMRLDLAGVAASAGAACSSGKVSGSPVLKAMGIESELAHGAIRISQALYTKNHEIDQLLVAWGKAMERISSAASPTAAA